MDDKSIKARKFDGNKLRMDLIPPSAIEGLAEVLGYGANKYSDNEWQKLENAKDRYYAALMRHLIAYRKGEQNDPESGIHHLKHIMTNAAILLYFEDDDTKQLKLDI